MAPQGKSSARNRKTSILKSYDGLLANAGIAREPFLKALKADLRKTADPIRAANNLHRFLSTGFSSSLLRDFQRHAALRRVALELFAQSQYLADILVRDPELFHWLTTTQALKVTKPRSEFMQSALASVQVFARTDRKMDALKRFHRREMLRIGARDILKEAPVESITRELSDLADTIVEMVVQLGSQELSARTGGGPRNTFVVIGLGKLGGQELNFSSDIDLLFVYGEDGEFESPRERIRTFHEYYNRLAEFVVRKLSEHTDEGFLYRVDMRLRPEGSAGTLALSSAASLQYYEIRGQTWERQMLIKARPLAGHLETGRRWINDLRPFVYPKTFLRSPLEELAAMKEMIESRVDVRNNLKLGEGGIRDIEFVVQGLQMLNGGHQERLREANTLRALELLAEDGKLPPASAARLREAYRFLRTTEHRLQLLHGGQTHVVPGLQTERELLARRLGFKGAKSFSKVMDAHRNLVRSVFRMLFEKKMTARRAPKAPRQKFLEPEIARAHLEALETALPSMMEHSSRSRFDTTLRKCGAADWALGSLAMIADAAPVRRALNQAWKNPDAADLLVTLGARSRAHAALIAREPLFFESILGQPGDIFHTAPAWEFLRENDPRRFESYNEYRLLIPHLAGQRKLPETFELLSSFAASQVHQFVSDHGLSDLCVLALGKLGGRELGIGSDLDLVFLFNKERTGQAEAEEAVQRLIRFSRSHGLREIDVRLRPEGHNAPIAVEIGYYREYLRTRASTWERQSLIKASALAGDPELQSATVSMIREFVYEAPFDTRWVEEIVAMRDRVTVERSAGRSQEDLKTGEGGLVDLEFALQMLQLRFGRNDPRVRQSNSFKAIDALAHLRLMPKSDARIMKKNLSFLRGLELSIRLNSDSTGLTLPQEPVRLQAVAAAVGLSSGDALRKIVGKIRQQNTALFERAARTCRR